MPGIVTAIAAVIGSIGAAVGSVVATIGSIVGSALGAAVAAISAITSSITAALSGMVSGLIQPVFSTVGSVIESIGSAIGRVTSAITSTTEPILKPIADALGFIEAKLKAVDAWVTEQFAPINTLIEAVDKVATLKILYDLTQGTASISDLLGAVAEGKGFETAQAIAQLTKNIASLGVGIIDRVDKQWTLLRAEVTTFEDRFKRNLTDYVELQKAETLALVTPRIGLLGEQQMALNKGIAGISKKLEDEGLYRTLAITRAVSMLYRHVEDETWFKQMLVRSLP